MGMGDHRAPPRIAAETLDRYFAGLASGEERKQVETWLAAHPAQRTRDPIAAWPTAADWSVVARRTGVDGHTREVAAPMARPSSVPREARARRPDHPVR